MEARLGTVNPDRRHPLPPGRVNLLPPADALAAHLAHRQDMLNGRIPAQRNHTA